MIAPALGAAWASLIVAVLAARRPFSVPRLNALVRATAPRRSRLPVALALPVPTRGALVAYGAALVATALVFPPAALAVFAFAVARPLLRQRRAATQRRNAVERDLADVVTLIALAVNSGDNLAGALGAAAAYGSGPLSVSLRAALATVARGARLADALEQLPASLGEPVRPLVAALVSCDRYGAALAPTLDRLGADVRVASRQRAEAAARRLPIRLLFPLVSCILPAFGLLTVAPLIAGSFRDLGL